MKKQLVFNITIILFLFSKTAFAGDRGPAGINWSYGPGTEKVGGIATIHIPGGYVCVGDKENIKKVVEYIGTIFHPNEIFVLSSIDLESKNSRWMSFTYDPIGFVRVGDQGDIDADGILESGRESTDRDNKDRKAKGYLTGEINGWVIKPHYGKAAHHLEWAYDCSWYNPKGGIVNNTVNYYSKYLGQHGVLTAQLSMDKGKFKNVFPEIKKILKTLRFNPENRYKPSTAIPAEIIDITFNDLISPGSGQWKTKKREITAAPEKPAVVPAGVPIPATVEKTVCNGWMWVSAVLFLLLLATWVSIIVKKVRRKKRAVT